MKQWCFAKVMKILFCIVLAGLIMGTLIMFLWNWLIPGIFHGPEINFIQALGLLALAKLLFGFGGWRRRRCHCNVHGHEGPRGYWKKRWEEKFSKMSPEEKEKFKQGFRRCWSADQEEKQQEGQ